MQVRSLGYHGGHQPRLRESPTHGLPFLSFSPSIMAETVAFCRRGGREEGPRKHFRVPNANHHACTLNYATRTISPSRLPLRFGSTASCCLSMEDAESKSGEAFSCSTEDELSASRRSSFESKTMSDSDAKADDERTDSGGAEQVSEIASMKERLSKLLLGEDMSGCGKGVCTALAISNAVTNLCATVFGQLWRLEPLPPEKKSRWRREMEWLLCVSDHIVEFKPTLQTFPDGSELEVMTCRPRPDLYINLPALRKLDNMLLEILDSFSDPEFWYVDRGTMASDSDSLASFRRRIHQQDEKWWLPVPRVPAEGIRESTRKQLQHQRGCAKQILKASVAINSSTLAEMEVPDCYFDSLPKNLRASMGETMYSYITSEQFSPDRLLDRLDLSSEHQALEIANRIEASIHVWRRRRSMSSSHRTRSSWGIARGMVTDAEKSRVFASRAESILLCLKQRFPGLTQTALDVCKIQFNKDVGKSILESYSRVLESLAFNIVARIDELLYVDGFSKCAKISFVDHHRRSVPGFDDTDCWAPSFSPATAISPAREERQRERINSSNVIERAEFPCMKAGAQGSGKELGRL